MRAQRALQNPTGSEVKINKHVHATALPAGTDVNTEIETKPITCDVGEARSTRPASLTSHRFARLCAGRWLLQWERGSSKPQGLKSEKRKNVFVCLSCLLILTDFVCFKAGDIHTVHIISPKCCSVCSMPTVIKFCCTSVHARCCCRVRRQVEIAWV